MKLCLWCGVLLPLKMAAIGVTGGSKLNGTAFSKFGKLWSAKLLLSGIRGRLPVGRPKITSEFVFITSPGEIGISANIDIIEAFL